METLEQDDEALGLDIDACDGCGLCIPACPSGALHIHFPWVIRPFGGQMIALFACEKSGIEKNAGLLPCIHSLGLRQLLLLYNSGIKYLLIATAECEDCVRHRPTGVHQRLEQLNNLLHERNKPPMKILQRSNSVWMKLFTTDELNENCCNGCDICIKLCPTNALQLFLDEEDSLPGYQLNPASCTGCGICTAVCDLQAISIHSWSISTSHSINLLEKCCMACGNIYHLPQQNTQSEEELCRICRKHNHSSNLFQVLAEN
jgi:ferredoxin